MNKKNRSSGNLEKWISELVYIAVINDFRSLSVFPGKKEKRSSKFGSFLWKPHQKIRMTVKAAIFVITDLGFKKPTYRAKVTMSLDCNYFFSELDIYAQIDINCYIQGQRKWYQIMHWSTLTNSSVWPIPYACVQPYHSGSGSHRQLFCPYWGSSAWYSRRINEGGKVAIPRSRCVCFSP